jgi:hypothetical protein
MSVLDGDPLTANAGKRAIESAAGTIQIFVTSSCGVA